jgi:hypothetical protein
MEPLGADVSRHRNFGSEIDTETTLIHVGSSPLPFQLADAGLSRFALAVIALLERDRLRRTFIENSDPGFEPVSVVGFWELIDSTGGEKWHVYPWHAYPNNGLQNRAPAARASCGHRNPWHIPHLHM